MQEFDTRNEAKKRAEYITPVALRDFLASKITKYNITVLEPAIGSGQLLFNVKNQIKLIDGYDVCEEAINVSKANFQGKLNAFNADFITANIEKEFDVAIANYPFSLPPTDEQKEFISQDAFLRQFYDKNHIKDGGLIDSNSITSKIKAKDIKGKLDFIFILKSFYYAQEGHYLAFPGIGYREQELKFRKYLIDNKLIKEIGIINNANFQHTTISVLYIHLTKEPNETTKSFSLDLKTNEMLESFATFENYVFDYPQKEIDKEQIDSVLLEKQAREYVISFIQKQLSFSQAIYNLDFKIQNSLPTIEQYKQEIIKTISKIEL